jgi:antitoxin ParD1/3/4
MERLEIEDMATVEKISIALPRDMAALLRDAVATGEYASSSEVIRDALRDWKYKRALRQQAIEELRAAVMEGLNSGPGANLDIETIIARAKTRRSAAAED